MKYAKFLNSSEYVLEEVGFESAAKLRRWGFGGQASKHTQVQKHTGLSKISPSNPQTDVIDWIDFKPNKFILL